ncbi:unnamed protein product [Lupinus luteus]|uniref:Non-haem dioxygenase N-terminal domain-containing protein n=1 Tax=Lupinus luteus TaxID=3873 RepID=A0AAV1W899_LUPLU
METLRVQNVASHVNGAIPAMFVRSETEQPGITTVQGSTLQVPIIDFSNPNEEKVLKEIMEASCEWGMFQIVNHDIPSELIRKYQAVGKEFFELSQEEKEKYAKDPNSQSLEGYGTKLQKELDGKKGWVDHLFHKLWPLSDINYRFWPEKPHSYREVTEEYAKYLHGVVDQLFRALSLGLGLEGHELRETVISNGKYKPVWHRTTVSKNETRMSWPVFIEPQPEQEVEPHPKLINKDNPPKFKPKKFKDYAYCKLNKIPQ